MFSYIDKHKTKIVAILTALAIILFFHQCQKLENKKNEIKKKEDKIENAMKALEDSSVVIRQKEEDLSKFSKELDSQKEIIDSMADIETETVTNTKIKYKDTGTKEAEGSKTDSNTYQFNYNDKIMSFKGNILYNLKNNKVNFRKILISDKEIRLGITNFSYNEDSAKLVDAEPFYIDKNGDFGERISNVNLEVRGFEKSGPQTGSKDKYNLTIGPSIGVFYTPNGLSYGAGISVTFGRSIH